VGAEAQRGKGVVPDGPRARSRKKIVKKRSIEQVVSGQTIWGRGVGKIAGEAGEAKYLEVRGRGRNIPGAADRGEELEKGTSGKRFGAKRGEPRKN